MAQSKLVKLNQKIEEQVVGGYKKIEKSSVAGFQKIADRFVDAYVTKDGEIYRGCQNTPYGREESRRITA